MAKREPMTVSLAGPDGTGWTLTGDHAGAMAETLAALVNGQVREAMRREKWGPIGAGAMERLASMFPLLAGKPGTEPWDSLRLDRWAASDGCHDDAALFAARFCLKVWNPYEKRACGAFELFEAWAHWDDQHRAAALAWLEAPFYP